MQIVLTGVAHRFAGGPTLFPPLTTVLAAGELVAVVGPSGAGKSTLLAMLAGLLEPSEGVVARPDGFSACWVTQNPHGVPGRSAVDHVAWTFLARGMDRRTATCEAERLLAEFGLAEVATQPYGTLSGGQAQRVMLARGVAAAPNLVLVDEPTAQLDQHTALEVDTALRRLSGGDQIVVVATHSESTRSACDRVISLAS